MEPIETSTPAEDRREPEQTENCTAPQAPQPPEGTGGELRAAEDARPEPDSAASTPPEEDAGSTTIAGPETEPEPDSPDEEALETAIGETLDAEQTAVPGAEAASPEQSDLLEPEPEPATEPLSDADLKAVLEAVVYVTEEPLTIQQIAAALNQPGERIERLLEQLVADYNRPERGLTVREVAGGYKMGTKPEHHEAVRNFVKNLKPPLKLSLAALETLAVIAYKQPITAPEIMEIRGVQGAGVLKTLLDRKLIATAGRKQVVGKPILYKTTKDFLVQFGLRDLAELPTLKEFEELRRLAVSDAEMEVEGPASAAAAATAEATATGPGPDEAAIQPATVGAGEGVESPEVPDETGQIVDAPAAEPDAPSPEAEQETSGPAAASSETGDPGTHEASDEADDPAGERTGD